MGARRTSVLAVRARWSARGPPMSQHAGQGAQPQPTLTETLVEAHERAQDAVTLSGRRIRTAMAAGDLGRIETAASDVVVTLFETADVVLSKVMAVPSQALPTSLFQSCMDAPNEEVHHDAPSANALSASFASVVKLSTTADAAGKAPAAPQPGTAPASTANATLLGASPVNAGSNEPPTQSSPLKAGFADGLRTLQQVPERLNEAVSKMIESDDLSSNQEQARCSFTGPLRNWPRSDCALRDTDDAPTTGPHSGDLHGQPSQGGRRKNAGLTSLRLRLAFRVTQSWERFVGYTRCVVYACTHTAQKASCAPYSVR